MASAIGTGRPLPTRDDSTEHAPIMNGLHTSTLGGESVSKDDAINHEESTLNRRLSISPGPAYMVSAPGKVIVYGEHAVVHGKAAMAAAISLRSYLLVIPLPKPSRSITLCFRDISLDHTWDIDSLPWPTFMHPSRRKSPDDLVTSLDPELVTAMQPHVAQVSANAPTEVRKVDQAAASAFLYLFMSLCSPESPSCVYTLRSTIPIGAGLGSSASTSVCIATALMLQDHALSTPHPGQSPEEAEKQLERINRWAFVGEMLIHGNPSGVDNTVATRGKAVIFKRADPTKLPVVTSLNTFPELPLLLVDTRQAKSTAAEVAKVARLKKAVPAVAQHILDAIDSITETAHALISDAAFDSRDPAAIAKLGELASINHGLLVSLGVSHPKLERLRHLVDQSGVGWTKLTGAGGGGCAITLLKLHVQGVGQAQVHSTVEPSSDSAHAAALHALEAELDREGYAKYETTLGGDGVGVLLPAVLHGEPISQDRLLGAEGSEGIERLAGVSAGAHGDDEDGWKFWRV